ncbi:hypothetical protein B0H63DRAFT_485316 [Podospora didyma]|uniref:Uncharacterized protein n=1 Tax=Podospora didyma TaxID=330526 RepID=A0AAE0N755_9PEZI|nr:hypothetical protein B0H63DRAFT_485316 [Podospora didyma]
MLQLMLPPFLLSLMDYVLKAVAESRALHWARGAMDFLRNIVNWVRGTLALPHVHIREAGNVAYALLAHLAPVLTWIEGIVYSPAGQVVLDWARWAERWFVAMFFIIPLGFELIRRLRAHGLRLHRRYFTQKQRRRYARRQ